MSAVDSKLTRIGVFYDGNFFYHVSNYYTYQHERRARMSVSGLHDFVRQQVADSEGSDVKYCQIVDAHYFRGRLRAHDAEQRGALLRDRLFDDILVREGVVTHYLPLKPDGEMGIDVWLALEAYELAIYKRFDVSVLVACDGDFLPLVRKLNTLGTRVMLLAWDFQYMDQNQQERETRTAQVLLDEVTYPIMMHQIIDDRSRRNDAIVNNLFLSPRSAKEAIPALPVGSGSPQTGTQPALQAEGSAASNALIGESFDGVVKLLKEGYGFITPSTGAPNLFFFHAEVLNCDFNELKPGDRVRYRLGQNTKGTCAIEVEIVSPAGNAR